MKFDTNNHAIFNLNYHLIMVIKYRRKVINDEISNRLKEMFSRIGVSYQINVLEWNYDVDHVHVLFKATPSTNISKFLNAYKSASSRYIKLEFPSIKEKLWKEYFWSRSYCLITTGEITLDVIKQYIQSQGENSD